MRVLAVDPALRSTGYAVLEAGDGAGPARAVTYGVIGNSRKTLPSHCYSGIYQRLCEIIREHGPTSCALESIIYVQSVKTAITMGGVRASVLIAAAEAGLEVFEYPPRRVKQAVVGRGGADKGQVAFMVRSILSLTETPPPDAADALAIGLTHHYTRGRDHRLAPGDGAPT